MLSKLSRFIERHLQPVGDASTTSLSLHQKQVTVAALLIEVAMADHEFSSSELERLAHLLTRKFDLSPAEISELIELAKSQSEHATSLHQFTRIINQYCTSQEKFDLMRALWEVAYVDGTLDKYEDYVIRKIADLIYVPHNEFIRAKSLVKAGMAF